MICTHPDHTIYGSLEDRMTRRTALSSARWVDSETDASMPLLAAITAELREAGELDELASLRAARRILEEAFRAIDRAPARR